MGRIIKFRAWDRVDSVMLDFETLLKAPVTLSKVISGQRDRVCDVMQLTGLHDKNGVEIYEGDLISDGHFTWEVLFSVDSWVCNLISHCNSKINTETLSNIIRARSFAKMPVKVIGNIYENKEPL